MPSILIIILVLQIVIHIINTIGAKTINDLLWQLSNTLPIPLPFVRAQQDQAKEVLRLRRDVVRLKREMNAISAQDDFARWAKIRREHDRVLVEHDKKASQLSSTRSSFDSKASVLRWLGTSGARFLIQFWHGKTAVFLLPKAWLPWYVEWVLGFPRCPYGGVSVNVWTAVCGVVVALVGDAIVAAVGLVQGDGNDQKKTKTVPTPVGAGVSSSPSTATGTSTRAEKKEL